MKNILLTAILFFANFVFAQSENQMKSDIEKIKMEITELRTEIQSVKSQNIYLKKVLDINNPILELKINNNEYRITKVIGNKIEKTIAINFLIETKDENKTSILRDFAIVDLQGNEYKVDFNKSSNTNPNLTLNVPINIKITFEEIVDEPKIIKLFRFSSRNEPERNSLNFNKSKQEFKDLNVIWK